ncbi:hypothetical protein RHGRI_011164 [Rhododendron griersonianum]|uniref:DNA topoisomerase (ATP-hydrolyzing) n=1 Tax=Rhododendron griersonianum TaxID=479676 RepID=A0AAV6KL09_9ERIC|nr:hypothetical protein RHGRI_011164 [Rhododendron griersonianum]
MQASENVLRRRDRRLSHGKVFNPLLLFDRAKKTTGGRNGYGAKLTNIFSTEFVVEMADGEREKKYKQAIVNNLPPTWPKATIFKNLKLNFMDMRALGAMFEEIETDIICSEALDEVEQQFTEQEEKQGKKPRQKVAKRRLEFDEL